MQVFKCLLDGYTTWAFLKKQLYKLKKENETNMNTKIILTWIFKFKLFKQI